MVAVRVKVCEGVCERVASVQFQHHGAVQMN